ncbi:MAG: hypothetical protein IKU43_03845 [Clostridia bacterium]|nr:hypothetical protein [Clostridia bacterium]
MYKYSAPIMISSLKEEELDTYNEYLQRCDIKRVFLALPDYIFGKKWYIDENKESAQRKINYFKEKGYEVGIWTNSFGHGAIDGNSDEMYEKFTSMKAFEDGANGGLCPLDKNFVALFCKRVKTLCELSPDIIMLDDDLRYQIKGEKLFCCCPLHMAEFRKRIGEDISEEQLHKYLVSGGANKYRTEFHKLVSDSMTDFAKALRSAVDEVNPNIRLGHCACHDTWDFIGQDNIKMSLAFAGNTKPYLRTIGAPYHGSYVGYAVENTRMQASWCRDYGIEVFAEGDTYYRPRYICPSSRLELFDMGLLASGELDGVLKYMFDYVRPVGYETGYAERHYRINKQRAEIAEIFKDKKNVGVRVCEVLQKFESWEYPEEIHPKLVAFMERASRSQSQLLLSRNAIPLVYEKTDYPITLFGENARYVTESDLENGAIIDISAAKILKSRGIDTGYISSEKASYSYETFTAENDYIERIEGLAYHKVNASEKVEVLTKMMPAGDVGVYRYENENGQKFLVFPYDAYDPDNADNIPYMCNYYRKKQLSDSIEWLCGKKLPTVVDPKHPMLYQQTSENEDKSAMSVLFLNSFDDYETDVEITLYKQYKTVRFVNCTGKLCGSKVIIDRIDAHGFAAFEVRE